jgi:ElaB/YqjD/DUF883 family membrane-anchored ribosome-binding protein
MATHRTAETARAFQDTFRDTRQELEPILASIEEAIASGGADAKTVIAEKGQAFMALASEMLDAVAADTADMAGAAVGRAREAASDGIACTEDCIRARPLTSVAIAFVSGWVLSRFMARRDSY